MNVWMRIGDFLIVFGGKLAVTIMLVLVCVAGWLLAFGSAEYFQRFGSAIVAVAVVLISVSKFTMEVNDHAVGAFNGGLHDLSKYEKLVLRAELNWLQLRTAELALVIWGTIQWGYGDLIHTAINGNRLP